MICINTGMVTLVFGGQIQASCLYRETTLCPSLGESGSCPGEKPKVNPALED